MLNKQIIVAAAIAIVATSCGSSEHPACKEFNSLVASCVGTSAANTSATIQGCVAAADAHPENCDSALEAAAKCMKGKSCEAILDGNSVCSSAYAAISTDCFGSTFSNVLTPTEDPNAAADANSKSTLVARPDLTAGARALSARFQER